MKMVEGVSIQNLLLNNYDYSTFFSALYGFICYHILLCVCDNSFALENIRFLGVKKENIGLKEIKKPLKYLGLVSYLKDFTAPLMPLQIIKQFEQLRHRFFKFGHV